MYVFYIYNKKRLSEKTVFKARVAGFEPANDGIRIRCLTAWRYPIKSAKRDSNSRPSPWQGDALPLSHSRIKYGAVEGT